MAFQIIEQHHGVETFGPLLSLEEIVHLARQREIHARTWIRDTVRASDFQAYTMKSLRPFLVPECPPSSPTKPDR